MILNPDSCEDHGDDQGDGDYGGDSCDGRDDHGNGDYDTEDHGGQRPLVKKILTIKSKRKG